MGEINGEYKSQLQKIQHGVDEIRDDLSRSINKLTLAIEGLSEQVKIAINVAQTVIPIKVVFWMWIIMLVGLVGIEGIKHLPKFLTGIG